MKNMLYMIIDFIDGETCLRDVIPGHSDEIADILNGYITNLEDVIKDEVIKAKVISEIATQLLKECLARDFIMKSWQKRYYGNEGLGKALTLSFACGRCINEDCHGANVIANGPAGYGKSDGIGRMLGQMPVEYAIQGKESAQAMFYDERPAGCIRYKDEIDFKNADDIKQQWTYFQTGVPKFVTNQMEMEVITPLNIHHPRG